MTAYETYLLQSADRFIKDFPANGRKEVIANFIYMDCLEQNQQAFALMTEVGDTSFSWSSFDKAADLLMEKEQQAA